MCKYCDLKVGEVSSAMFRSADWGVYLMREESTGKFNQILCSGLEVKGSIKINSCPQCGRYLNLWRFD